MTNYKLPIISIIIQDKIARESTKTVHFNLIDNIMSKKTKDFNSKMKDNFDIYDKINHKKSKEKSKENPNGHSNKSSKKSKSNKKINQNQKIKNTSRQIKKLIKIKKLKILVVI